MKLCNLLRTSALELRCQNGNLTAFSSSTTLNGMIPRMCMCRKTGTSFIEAGM